MRTGGTMITGTIVVAATVACLLGIRYWVGADETQRKQEMGTHRARGNDAQRHEKSDELIAALRGLRLDGVSRGGPYVGVEPNRTTQQIVARGSAIVPALIERLDSDTIKLNEAIYIVFCLRELKATQAEHSVRHLKDALDRGRRFPGRDMTLDMQIRYYLRDAEAWGKEAGKAEGCPSPTGLDNRHGEASSPRKTEEK